MSTVTYAVEGMTCGHCVQSVPPKSATSPESSTSRSTLRPAR